jgi:hypothetical protein
MRHALFFNPETCPALYSLFQKSKIRNLYPVKSPQSGARIAKFNRAGPKSNTPSFFTTFWGFSPQMGKYMINANLDNYLHYFGDLRVFLKTSGNPKGAMISDPEFKRQAYQALDTGNLSR